MNQIMGSPKVSIVIPVYNGSDYLKKAIDSALNQSYQNIEIIVVNDGSSDGDKTEKIAKSYGDKIKYYKKENGGVSSALNLGINRMTGDYFSWLSHDDEYKEDKVERQVELLMKVQNPKAVALCDTEFIDTNSKVLEKKWATPESGIYDSEQALLLMIHKSLSGIALMIPRDAFSECGVFDTTLRFTQDADMWRRLFLNGYFLIVDKNRYARSRLHGKQQTNTHRERFKEENEKTLPDFCRKLCDKKMYGVAQGLLLATERNSIRSAAKAIRYELEKHRKLPLKIKTKAELYRAYGVVRPYIRELYYKAKFGVESKDSKG